MVGIAGGSCFVLPVAPLFLFVGSVLLALVCWRWPVVQSVLIGVCFVTLGLALGQKKGDLSLEGNSYEAVVMSEPAERPKTVGVDLLIPAVGKSVRCYLWKEERSMSLKLGDAVVVRLANNNNGDNDRRPLMYFVKSHDWQLGGNAVEHLSRMQRSRLFFLNLRHKLLLRYQALHADESVYGVLAAMTLGDKSALTDETKEAYNVSGASHVLALSGLHLGIIYMFLTWLTLKRPRFWLSQILIVTAIWAFAFLTGLSPSVTRSATMISIYAVFAPRSRGRASLNVLAFAAIVMLIVEPQTLFEVGFQMSFAAVFAILLFMPLFERLWQPRQLLLRLLWGSVIMSTVAQLGVGPLIAYYFGRFSTCFILTNFIVVPAAFVIIFGALLTLLFPPVGQVLVWITDKLNLSLNAIASLPFSSIEGLHPSGLQVVLIYILIAIIYFMARILLPIVGESRRGVR